MEAVLESLTTGLPILILHFLVTVTMLAIGVTVYMWITPFRELQLIRDGNVAAAVSLGAAIMSLAVPLAFCMSVSVGVADIIVWGLVTLAILLIVYRIIDFLLKDLPTRIEAGEVGPAILLASVKIGVAATPLPPFPADPGRRQSMRRLVRFSAHAGNPDLSRLFPRRRTTAISSPARCADRSGATGGSTGAGYAPTPDRYRSQPPLESRPILHSRRRGKGQQHRHCIFDPG